MIADGRYTLKKSAREEIPRREIIAAGINHLTEYPRVISRLPCVADGAAQKLVIIGARRIAAKKPALVNAVDQIVKPVLLGAILNERYSFRQSLARGIFAGFAVIE